MNWTAPVDIYCERTGPEFWSEPLNALTNLAFILAAIFALRLARREGRMDGLTLVMITLAFLVGLGSFTFHTVAQRWSGPADTVPILLFILWQIFIASRRYLGLSGALAALASLSFIPFAIAFSFAWRSFMPSLNGSQMYFPVIITLAGFGLLLRARAHAAAPSLLIASLIFAVSLTFRSIDQAVCGAVPVGTHIYWHMLNGLLFWVVMRAFILHGGASRLAPASRRG